MQQFPHFARTGEILRAYFRIGLGRNDVLVSGDGFLCRRAGEARRSPRPDVVVALNLPFDPAFIEQANGYTVEEIGQAPDFVLEVGSETTGRRDYTVKREIYAGLEVREYWRFDHTGGRYHDTALAGDLLVEGSYQPISVEQGEDGIYRGYSAALGLELHWAEGRLQFLDRATGEYLLDLVDSWAQRNAAQARLRQSETRLQQSETRLQQSENRREQTESQLRQSEAERLQAEERVRELEEMVRRLRESQAPGN